MADCIRWEGAIKPDGYGLKALPGTSMSAAKWAYEQVHGPLAPGLEIDHLCCNRPCIEVTHLEPVTHAENVRRARLRARGLPIDFEGPVPICTRHSDADLSTWATGQRICLACLRERRRELRGAA